jgi:hypothetical protein
MGTIREESDYTSRVYSLPFLFIPFFNLLVKYHIHIGKLYETYYSTVILMLPFYFSRQILCFWNHWS